MNKDAKDPLYERFAKAYTVQAPPSMEKLRPNDQLLLRLYYLEGYDYEELSQVLDINYGNCRTRLSRAKSKLKKILNDE